MRFVPTRIRRRADAELENAIANLPGAADRDGQSNDRGASGPDRRGIAQGGGRDRGADGTYRSYSGRPAGCAPAGGNARGATGGYAGAHERPAWRDPSGGRGGADADGRTDEQAERQQMAAATPASPYRLRRLLERVGFAGARDDAGGVIVPAVYVVAFGVLWAITLLPDAGRWMWRTFLVDDRPPVEWPNFSLDNSVYFQGDIIRYAARGYRKRAACAPPKADGDVRYRFEAITSDEISAAFTFASPVRRSAGWAASDGDRTAHGHVPVPVDLPPGRYRLRVIVSVSCAGASRRLESITPPREIEVRASRNIYARGVRLFDPPEL